MGVGEGANSLPVGYIRMAPRRPQKVTSELLLKGEWGSQRREEGESLSQAKKETEAAHICLGNSQEHS